MKSDRLKPWTFVAVQVVLLILLVFMADSATPVSAGVMLAGSSVEVVGVVILVLSLYDLRRSLTVLPTPKPNGVLQVRGLYRYVRHPMYTGVLTLSLGIAIVGGSWQEYALVAGLLVLFTLKARYEETLLTRAYSGYKAYAAHTPRFLPHLC